MVSDKLLVIRLEDFVVEMYFTLSPLSRHLIWPAFSNLKYFFARNIVSVSPPLETSQIVEGQIRPKNEWGGMGIALVLSDNLLIH